MASPWVKIEKPDPVNLEDIISDEVTRNRQTKEGTTLFLGSSGLEHNDIDEVAVPDDPEEVLKGISDDGTYNSDAMISQVLQIEYDEEIKKTERLSDKSPEHSISVDNQHGTPPDDDTENDPEEEQAIDILDRFDPTAHPVAAKPSRAEKKVATKYELVMNRIKKACKVHLFPPLFPTGETANELSQVHHFQGIKMSAKHEQAKTDRTLYYATIESALTEYTHQILYKMFEQKLLKDISGVIGMGKDAVFLHAETDSAYPEAGEDFPKECVIKVFRSTFSESKEKNIRGDWRFMYRYMKNLSPQKWVQLWAEKEMLNLERLKNAEIPCPHVLSLKHHVLVMSFVGKDKRPAVKLKDAGREFEDLVLAYDQVVNQMKTMYEEAHLVHADLSEHNILWHNQQCHYIDVSQAIEPQHEDAYNFLVRDCTNITNFFKKKGVPKVMSPQELFKHIARFEFGNKFTLTETQESFKTKPGSASKKPGRGIV